MKTTLKMFNIKTSPFPQFLIDFEYQLNEFIPHSFKVNAQHSYFTSLQQTLKPNEALVVIDFSEQYQCIIQRQHQSYKFCAEEVTLHVSCIWYVDSENGTITTKFHIVVSDLKTHDATTVNLFQGPLLDYVASLSSQINHVIYGTDGAPGHYKNKFAFANLTYHDDDFGLTAELHMRPTAHGKTVCDGQGGNRKHCVRDASVGGEDITNAEEFFTWCKVNNDKFPTVYFDFVSKEEYPAHKCKLESRYQNVKLLKGTQKYHAFYPIDKYKIEAKYFSNETFGKVFDLAKRNM